MEEDTFGRMLEVKSPCWRKFKLLFKHRFSDVYSCCFGALFLIDLLMCMAVGVNGIVYQHPAGWSGKISS
jgi:hypothetical protein